MKNITTFLLSVFIISLFAGCAAASFTSYTPHEGNTYWMGADGGKIVLTNNNSAKTPTYAQLLVFLKADTTDQRKYTSKYTCGDFAETLHNNAEKKGYKTAWVSIQSINHACNAFQTSDKGLVFIDCTGVPSGGKCYDTKVAVKTGTSYKRVPLFCSNVYFGSMGTVRSYKIYW
jgi:hypothetical protein